MIIYNNNREFIGIDEENLKSLGYSNLASLLTEAADFADLFVKVPGHVHNFKHVHWIDFILCATDKNSSKAIIHASGKSFSCVLDIKTIYLSSAPTKQSYNISLNNLRALSPEELQNISGELQTRSAPVAAPVTRVEEPVTTQESEDEPEIKTPTEASRSEHIEDEFDSSDNDIEIDELPELETAKVEEDPYEIEDEFNLDVFEPSKEDLEKIGEADDVAPQSADQDSITKITRDDLHKNLHEHVSMDDIESESALEQEQTPDIAPTTQESTQTDVDGDEEEYTFDIQETADALEMDVATIQDFVDDFIMQAKDFKPKLYEAVHNDDMIELKSLSHQLKGVAANLRIHDAQEILIDINKADDFTYSIRDLDKFYNIISKLAGEEPMVAEQPADIDEQSLGTEDDKPLEINDDDQPIELEDDEPLEINDDDQPIELEDDEPLEINDDDQPIELEDDEPLEINDDDQPIELEDDEALEINDDQPLEIDDSDFDSLDIEQEELIGNNNKNELLNEIEESKSTQKYNKMSVANEIGLDEESFNELFEDFSNESKVLISEAQEGIDAQEPAKWQDAARRLKGMSDNMRVTSFESDLEALITLQDSSNAQQSLNKISETLLSILESKD